MATLEGIQDSFRIHRHSHFCGVGVKDAPQACRPAVPASPVAGGQVAETFDLWSPFLPMDALGHPGMQLLQLPPKRHIGGVKAEGPLPRANRLVRLALEEVEPPQLHVGRRE